MPQHTRRSPRWCLHDYRRAGLYFVTVCTAGRALVFGEVTDGRMALSPLGQIAAAEWDRTLALRPELLADVFVVMPNHVHLLFGILDGDPEDAADHPASNHHRRDTINCVPTNRVPTPAGDALPNRGRRFGAPLAKSVSSVVKVYKAAVTRQARRLGLWGDGPLWQGRFHDRVVRTAAEADRVRRYVTENPARWPTDRYGPPRPPGRRR